MNITQCIELLDCKLASELIKPYDLVQVLIKANPVIIVWTHEDINTKFHEFLYEVSLTWISFTIQPQVRPLLSRIKYMSQHYRTMMLLTDISQSNWFRDCLLFYLFQVLIDLEVSLYFRKILSKKFRILSYDRCRYTTLIHNQLAYERFFLSACCSLCFYVGVRVWANIVAIFSDILNHCCIITSTLVIPVIGSSLIL